MATNEPRQKRSRERVEKIMLAAGDLLAKTADADALTTTSVSTRSGVPVATIYRYFADRSAIISALIDRETAEIDEAVIERLGKLETVSFSILLETIMRAHLDHFQASRRSIVLWFGTRKSNEVIGRVERRYKYLGEWLRNGAMTSGMAVPETPAFGPEMIVWICDRTFEFIFREERTPEEEALIMELALDVVNAAVQRYDTALGRDGISREAFRESFGPYAPPSGSP